VLRLVVAFGLVFELPVLSYVLARLGIVNAGLLRRGRRYALVGMVVLAALLTPPDVISQLLMAGPLFLLYEVSIWVARMAGRPRETPS
jgi:sec-independent protein translocase protein TatC